MTEGFKYDEYKCPECQGEMTARNGKFGKFWGCNNFPECRGTRDANGLSKQERQSEREKEKGYSPSEIEEPDANQTSTPKTSFNRKKE